MTNGHQLRPWPAGHQRPSSPECGSSTPDPRPSSQRVFHGVRMRRWGRWVSEIRIPNSRDKIWLGSYANPEQAARAYDIAALLLCSPFPLNFSDSPSLLRLPHLSAASSPPSRGSIQATAYLAALSAPAGCATINCLHPDLEVGSATLDHAYFYLEPVNSSADVQEDSSWIQEVQSLLAPEEPGTIYSTSNVGADSSIHGVLDAAAAISLSDIDGGASCSAAAGGEEQEQEHLMTMNRSWSKEYEEAFVEMLAVDGFTATSAPVTTSAEI